MFCFLLCWQLTSLIVELFRPPLLRHSLISMVVLFTISFGCVVIVCICAVPTSPVVIAIALIHHCKNFTTPGRYYGLVLWLPRYFEYIQQEQYNCSGANVTYPVCNSSNDRLYLDNVYVALSGVPGEVIGVVLISIITSLIFLTIVL